VRASVALLVYALTMATLGGAWLRRVHWPERAPRLGVLAWQALSWSILAAVTLAGLVLAVPVSTVGGDLAAVLDACAMLLRQQYSTPGGVTAGVVGLVLTLGVTSRVALVLAQSFWAARNARVHQHRRLGLVARVDTVLGVARSRPLRLCGLLPPRRAARSSGCDNGGTCRARRSPGRCGPRA